MRVLTFTNLYPNPEQPERGKFVSQMVEALPPEITNVVVSPLPWYPQVNFGNSDKFAFAKIPYRSSINRVETFYPKYCLVPRISGAFHAFLIAISSYSLIKSLNKNNKIDLIHAHWIYPDCIAAVWLAKRLSIPIVISARGCDINLYGKYKFRSPQIGWALNKANAITTVSDALRNEIIKRFAVNGQKVITIRNGVNTRLIKKIDKYTARSTLKLEKDSRYLLFVGELHEVKGLSYLIEAINLLKMEGNLKFRTILVGEGAERKNIEGKINHLGLREYVRLVGKKPHEQVSIWMSACDVFCLPSLREGTPNVILEAKSCNMPIVATNVGGIPEIIDNDNGILVPPQDFEKLAVALLKGFDFKPINTKNTDDYSWQDCAGRYADLYSFVVNDKTSTLS